MPILQLCKRSGVSYGTLHRHVRHGRPVSLVTARKLAAASDGAITEAEVLGLDQAPARAAVEAELAANPRPAA